MLIFDALAVFKDIMFWIYALIVFIIVLGVIILIHEGGHFFFAKKADVLCHEFSIGMGPVVKQKKKGETSYSIRAIPIGGFVSMAGEDTNEELLKIDQIVGINFKSVMHKDLVINTEEIADGDALVRAVSDIIIDENMNAEVRGKVVSYDLYSIDGSAMYLDLDVDGEIKHFLVARDAFYIFNEKQKIQLAPYDRCFESKSLWKRFISVFAGPMMNFVLAIFIFIIVGLASGVPNYNSTVIGELTKEYPAMNDLKVGDKIVKVDDTDISTWTEFSAYMDEISGQEEIKLWVERDGEIINYTIPTVIVSYRLGVANKKYLDYSGNGIKVELVFSDDYVVGKAGLKNGDIILGFYNQSNEYIELNDWQTLLNYLDANPKLASLKIRYLSDNGEKEVTTSVWTESSLSSLNVSQSSKTAIGVVCDTHFDFIRGLGNAFVLFWNSITTVFKTLGALFGNSQISINDLSGPVGIFSAIKTYLGTDLLTFLSFVGLISANIGVVNLLPIPALDGGRILFLGYEAITRKKVNKKVETILNNIVFWLVMLLFVYITIKDIGRLF